MPNRNIPRSHLIIFFSLIFLSISNISFACPLIRKGLIDFNCDQTFKISVLGDSIARGRGDAVNGDQGGYAKRLEAVANSVRNLGVNGQTTEQLLMSLKRKSRKLVRQLKDSDLVIIDIGRNDYFDYLAEEVSIEQIVRNLVRITNITKRIIADGNPNKTPFVITGPLIRVNRTDQNIFVGELNEVIRRFHAQGKLPAYLEFDLNFSKTNLNADNLHPTSAGYDQIFKYVRDFIRNDLQVLLAEQRPDNDQDGIFDLFEPSFGMDPNNPDTNGDTVLDGQEVFGTL